MHTDFPDFLLSMKGAAYPDEDGEATRVFVPDNTAVSESDLVGAARRLGIQLPPSYREFLRILGPGHWCLDYIPAPQELYAFDSTVWGIEGFIPLVQNVRGVGDTLAINPADTHPEAEPPVYYCSHDPFGHVRVADSFEDWCRATATALREQRDYYDLFNAQVLESWHAYKKAHRWWKFW